MEAMPRTRVSLKCNAIQFLICNHEMCDVRNRCKSTATMRLQSAIASTHPQSPARIHNRKHASTKPSESLKKKQLTINVTNFL